MTERSSGKASKLPHFASEAEAGAFWDTHSPEDFADDFREVQVSFAKPLIKRGLTVKLSEETLAELRQRAEEQGVGPSTLARMWILEQLRRSPAR
jgi:predicted DNA binding CopG/RHH family protein